MGTNLDSTEQERTVIGKSVDAARNITRFCLAMFLWSHAFFLLNTQSRIIEYANTRIHVTTAEATLFVLLLTFSFLAGPGIGQTLINLIYIYFFPFVLLFYVFYWPIHGLRLLKVKTRRSADVAPGTLVLQASPTSLILTAPISERKNTAESKAGAALELLTRPFRKFTYLWCLLVLLAIHKSIVWTALMVVLIQLAGKMYRVVRLFWFSKSFLDKAATAITSTLNDTINKLSNLNFEATPLVELKNLLNQVKSFKTILGFITKSTFFSRLTFGLGLAMLVCAHLYFALIFSCVYVGGAKIADLTLFWPNSLAISIFILAYVTELPNTLLLRVLGGIHFMLFLTLGAGTAVSYFLRQLEPLRSALVSVNTRLSDLGTQEKVIVLQTKIDAAEAPSKKT